MYISAMHRKLVSEICTYLKVTIVNRYEFRRQISKLNTC